MNMEDQLKRYNDKKPYRFHMPGHKGKSILSPKEEILVYGNDITEIEGMDNLHNPKGVIKDMLRHIANTYGVRRTFMSINGSTTSLHAAILGLTNPKEKIIIARDCHKAVYNAMILGDLNPVYLPVSVNKDIGLINLDDLMNFETIIKDTDAKVVVITYPSYSGICCDIEEVVKIVHKYNKIIIVDEAHGSHMKFSGLLPISAEESGADVIVQSAHKTLPALTQTSMLHINTDLDTSRIESYLSILMTTSPSYLMMASLEKSVRYMADYAKIRLEENLHSINMLAKEFVNAGRVYKSRDYFMSNHVYDFDSSKLLFRVAEAGIVATHGKSLLRSRFNIEMEMADIEYINGFMTVSDEMEDLRFLFQSVDDIIRSEGSNTIIDTSSYARKAVTPEISMNIRSAFYAEKTVLPLNSATEEISGDYIIPYPPGIPLICPGEKITGELIDLINELDRKGIEILGLENGIIKVIKDNQ
ncbi:MAG: aminotransferase class V-fold PLP-dependent enzyme [Eubacteriales bacterium]|nr:aminotransferase class V-fold PLP-dependent enzyme [Eubacteriales bacterium]